MLTNWDLLAIIIALAGSITVMCLFWKQNIELTKEIYNTYIYSYITEYKFMNMNIHIYFIPVWVCTYFCQDL